jgi:hypothetical protein
VGRLAAAVCLECLELVDELDAFAMEGGLVAHDLVQLRGGRKDARVAVFLG